jgi:5-methylcytosine-specific restriction protein A
VRARGPRCLRPCGKRSARLCRRCAMPRRAPSPCRHPGCPALVESGGYCPAHRRERDRTHDERRPSSSKRGYGVDWRRYSRTFLAEHPFCAECGEIAQHTDHKVAVSGPSDSLFWEPTNHQPLCHACHSRKTATIDRHSPRHALARGQSAMGGGGGRISAGHTAETVLSTLRKVGPAAQGGRGL